MMTRYFIAIMIVVYGIGGISAYLYVRERDSHYKTAKICADGTRIYRYDDGHYELGNSPYKLGNNHERISDPETICK